MKNTKNKYYFRNILILMIMTSLVSSCATIHKVNFAKPTAKKKDEGFFSRNKTDSGLLISFDWNIKYSGSYFKYMDFTFENKSPDWIKIEKIGVSFDEKAKSSKISFLKGAPLLAFLKGKELEIKINEQNVAALRGAIAGLAVTATATLSDSSYQDYQRGLVTATLISEVSNSKKGAVNEFPEEHLFGPKIKFLVPPGLALTKYLVLYSRNPEFLESISNIYITYHLKDGTSEEVVLDVSWF